MALDKVTTAVIADDAVTGTQIENNPTVAGNLTVAGTSTLTGNATASGNVTVSGDLVPATPLSNRNLIINGGMQVWQRQTATTTAASGYSTVDRWAIYENSGATVTSEKHTMSVTELNTTGHRTALRLNCTVADTSVAATDYIFVRTWLEGQDLQQLQYGTANAKNITLSFWVKSDKTGVYSVALNKNSATRTQIPLEYTISSADTWEKKTITITPTMGSTNLIAVAAGAIDNNTSGALAINFTLMVGDNNEATANTWAASSTAWGTNAQVNWANETNDFYVTGVQLELGSNATPFEHRSFGDELRRCQRYYYVIADQRGAGVGMAGTQTGTSQNPSFANVSVYHTNLTYFHVGFPVMMRAAVTYEQTSGTNYYVYYASGNSHGADGFVANNQTMTSVRLNNSNGTLPGTTYGGWWQTGNAACFMAVSAEI